MPLTVGQVAALPDLGLLVRTSAAPTDRIVRWVAVSELTDPTPWLEGGDLLLTTGMSVVDDPAHAQAYVERLVAADVACLGFGVGLTHHVIPASLVDAAEHAGLPLLEVPQPVPFVAVSKAVSRLLVEEEYADSVASFESQRRLIRAALADEPGRSDQLIAVLAKHVGGFSIHLAATGTVVSASPASSAARAAELTGEIDRMRPRGLLASASVASADESIVILPIGIKGAADGFLVVGSPRSLRSGDQAVMNLAVSLLSWEVSLPVGLGEGMDAWRRLLIAQFREQGVDATVLADLGLSGLNPARAVALTWRGESGRVVPETVLSAANDVPGVVVCRRPSGDVAGFASVDADAGLPIGLAELVVSTGVHAVGVSRVLDLTSPENVRQAASQADRAVGAGSGLRHFDDDAGRGLASLIDAETTATWAAGYLGELMTATEGPELMDTLRAWLAQHGQVDAAAGQLGIHRHTVRHRIRRAEALLGRPLDDATVRADLWFALGAVQARD